jgi:L-rhamnose isomerase
VPGHRIGKKYIKLWITLGGSGKTKKQCRSPKQKYTEPVKQIYESRAVESTST